MATRLGRQKTGAKYIQSRKKKAYERTGQKKTVKLGEEKRKSIRAKGGNEKSFLLKAKFVNVNIKGNKKLEIQNVLETPSNRFLARQNIITKGTIVKTELGKVKITNRPTQQPILNGILIKDE